MTKPFDATPKDLVEQNPADWLRFAGFQPHGPVIVIDSDISTVIGAADKIIRVDEPLPWLAHIEFMSGYEKWIGLRLNRYSVMIEYRHGLPVHTILILLRPSADSSKIDGTFQRKLPDGTVYSDFRFQVIRVWELSVQALLNGGLATLPLAPLAVASETELVDVFDQMEQRLQTVTPATTAKQIRVASLALLGLRFSDNVVQQFIQRINAMDLRESSFAQILLREGRQEGLQEGLQEGRVEQSHADVLRIGTRRLGAPPDNQRIAIEAVTDLDRLQTMMDRAIDAICWEDVVAP